MSRPWLAALLLALFTTQSVAGDRIERIEPGSWWVGMKDDRLQLMVHGERIADLEPSVQYPGVAVAGVERVANPNYVFLNLKIAPDTQPGMARIEFRRGGSVVAKYEYPLQAREPGSAQRRGFGPQDVIYLVMPDRFANGDPTNDTVKELKDGLNRSVPLGRHGGDIQGIANHLDYVSGMGFTQLWLNPVVENAQPQYSYHGYSITDFYRVDPRLGTNASYRQLVIDARKRNLGMIQDVVLNHIGSGHWWLRDMPTPDWLNNKGEFVGTHHVRESLQDPHAAEHDRRTFADGWFVESMPDLNQRNPYLATYLIQNTLWWIEYAGLSGLRVDTYSYSDRAFLTEWSRRVMEEYPDINVVGEEWSGNPAIVSYWQRGRKNFDGYVSYLPAVFDFPLQEAVSQALLEKEDWGTGMRRIYRVLATDGLYPDPYNLVVFPDNHDVSRIYTVLGNRADLDRMAVAFFLTTRGIPQIFYGTEILMANPGPKDDGVIRSDFPGGWPGDKVNAFTGQGLDPAQRDMQEYMRKLLLWRRGAPALHHGKLTQFVPLGGIYVYFRHTDTQKVMVILNNGDEAKTVDTKRFHEVIGSATTGTDVITQQPHRLDQGIAAPAHSATILELN
jgi:glycosidase